MRLAWLLLVPLSGCFGFGHCGFMPSDVSWEDPALYDALEVNATAPLGLPIDIPGVAVSSVRSMAGAGHRSDTIHYDGARLRAEVDSTMREHDLALAARALLENGTRLSPDAIDERVGAFLDSRAPSHLIAHRYENGRSVQVNYTVYTLDQALDLDLLAQRLGSDGTPVRALANGSLHMAFAGATKHQAIGTYPLLVDLWGHATVQHHWPEGTERDQVEADVRAALAKEGLPQPPEMQVSGAIC